MTLTEQWEKGELPESLYYVKTNDDSIVILGWSKIAGWYNIAKVLAPVPSYDEWQRIFHYASKYEFEYTSCAMDYENLKEENNKLKELLYSLKCCLTSENIEPQIRVEKSLAKIDNAIGEKK